MNILLIGSGGREHALAWKILQSHHCEKLFIAPGNTGTELCGTNVALSPDDFLAIKLFCIDNAINIVVVGPEEPLVKGIYDYLKTDTTNIWNGCVIGASLAAAQLEGSKSFAKKFMHRYHIPTATYAAFTHDNFEAGSAYIMQHTLPIVLKADGLAAGKGVVIANTHEVALQCFDAMIQKKQFGTASETVVVEEFLDGIEVSVFVLTNGRDYQIIGHAKDYKRVGAGDVGLNTGGMGCVSPVPFVNDIFMQKVTDKIIVPTIRGLQQENLTYTGVIFFGLMNCNGEPFVIEYNCRMGDPETEVLMPLLETDIVALFAAMDNGTLADATVTFKNKTCCTIVATSGGYPNDFKKNVPIFFSEQIFNQTNNIVFHAGTKKINDTIVTNGGRVLVVSAVANNIYEANANAKKTLEAIHFEGMHFRDDIGHEFINNSK